MQKAVRKDTPFRVYWVEAETICREHAEGGDFCEKDCKSKWNHEAGDKVGCDGNFVLPDDIYILRKDHAECK